MAYISMFAVFIVVCSWISIPASVPFTLQTFAIFLAMTVLGGKRGTMAVVLYLLLGLVGMPVFSGFVGGLGVLWSNTGGFLIGFLAASLFLWWVEPLTGKRTRRQLAAMAAAQLICYGVAVVWTMGMVLPKTETAGGWTVVSWYVLPFVLPDGVKLYLAWAMGRKIGRWAM